MKFHKGQQVYFRAGAGSGYLVKKDSGHWLVEIAKNQIGLTTGNRQYYDVSPQYKAQGADRYAYITEIAMTGMRKAAQRTLNISDLTVDEKFEKLRELNETGHHSPPSITSLQHLWTSGFLEKVNYIIVDHFKVSLSVDMPKYARRWAYEFYTSSAKTAETQNDTIEDLITVFPDAVAAFTEGVRKVYNSDGETVDEFVPVSGDIYGYGAIGILPMDIAKLKKKKQITNPLWD